jgi:putative membrane protein
MNLLLRLLLNAVGLWAAAAVVPGVSYAGSWQAFLGVALVFTLVNAIVGKLVKVLTCPLILLTLGLFVFVINGLMLWLTSALSGELGLGLHVRGFWSAFFGGLVVSLVTTLLGWLVIDRPTIHYDRR